MRGTGGSVRVWQRRGGGSPRGARRMPAEAGVWVFIFGDMLLFALFFTMFLYYRGQDPEAFRRSQAALDQDLGVVNTLLLLSSSLFVVVAVRAIREGGSVLARTMLPAALVCGAGFVAVKYVEYGRELAAGHYPTSDLFFLCYYVFTGIHLVHLVIGMGVLVFLLVASWRPRRTPRQEAVIEGGACFWHMVDFLWIVLFPLLYLVR